MSDLILFLLTSVTIGLASPVPEIQHVDPLEARLLLSNDFESGFEDPWYDSSPSTVHWVIEDFSTPTEDYPPPTPLNGTKYLRATRDDHLTAGLLVLRTVTFTALPGDEISFNFWIHSKYMGGNTLEVVLSVDGVETIFLILSSYSSPDNVDWLVGSSPIPVTEPTEATLRVLVVRPAHPQPPKLPQLFSIPQQPRNRGQHEQLYPLALRTSLNNDFESGYEDPWYDNSPSTVHWIVEDVAAPTEDYAPPTLSTGSKYLRAVRDAQLTSGLLVLRTVTFTALPGDEISFTFWIRSRYTAGNTLQLSLVVGDTETVLLDLTSYSTSVNLEWRSISSAIPVTQPTDVTFIFRAFCGGYAEDAVAIDDILIESRNASTSTTQLTPPTSTCVGVSCPSTTTPATTTTSPTTPEPCGGSYDAASGTISSPHYPSSYGFNEDCRYKIQVASGNRVTLDFSSFNTENGYDFVTIYDGATAASPVLVLVSGTHSGLSVTTTGRDCLVLHTSDSKNSLSGWQANYTSV
ncbi:hypothetical protein GHT06_012158 [Daphnia sinensis]|uniref:CUB domain-containing protein n=1 Tax=Daphnia sinensis TaxID=1820382 RepID=A0AAD5KXV7_9CRUS|nr:hypothetical protein GHT06_012158 [Daphnia sinensis]